MLDHLGAAQLRFVGVLTGVTAGPALAEQIPGLVELDLNLAETVLLLFVESVSGVSTFQAVLLLHQGVDAVYQFGVTQVYDWSVRVRHRHGSSVTRATYPADIGGKPAFCISATRYEIVSGVTYIRSFYPA